MKEERRGNIEEHPYYDRLTQLPTRVLFEKEMKGALTKSQKKTGKIGVLLVDIDNLADLNNAYGYEFGDHLLQNIGEVIRLSFHRGEIVSHYESDCFAILIPGLRNSGDAIELAEKIARMFHMPWNFSGHECYSTVSIGISMYPDDGREPEVLIKNAQSALYFAKKHGKDRYEVYCKAMDMQITKRLNMEYKLRKAIEREEFLVYYQPQICIDTGKVVSVEALVRWKHPTEGMIPPVEFIPIAEETGLINPIGEWVLRTACKQINALNHIMQLSIKLAVNLSPSQFQKVDLSEDILRIIKNTHFNSKLLEIEITEEAAIKDINSTISVLKKLGAQNVQIALDDFCTGYSSLCYLELLPINKIKIDKSFVAGMNENHKKEAIVEFLINLAHKLDTVIVAEGVEEKSQVEALKQKKCDMIQGYYYCKPLSFKDLLLFVRENILKPKLAVESGICLS